MHCNNLIKIEKIIFKHRGKVVKEVFWKGVIDRESTNKICLTEYINSNSILFRKKLSQLINSIEEQNLTNINNFQIDSNFNFWFLTNLREKNFYKENKFFELTKILAIIDICEKAKTDQVTIDIDEKIYRDVLIKIFKKKRIQDINFNIKSLNQSPTNILSDIFNFLRSCRFLLSKIFYIKKKNKINSHYNLFVSFFTYIDKKKFSKNIYNSLFWGNINKYAKINFLHLFISNKISENFNYLNKKIQSLENQKETHSFLDENINLQIIVKIFLESIKIKFKFFLCKKKFKLNYNNFNISDAISFDLSQSFLFPNIVIKLYYFYLFKIFFEKNKFNSDCFYIHENQPWEKSLIYHWRKNNFNKIYGVINSSIRFWDLRFQKSKISPDFLLTNGVDSYNKALNFGYSSSEIKNVESLRYKKTVRVFQKNNNDRILIIFDYSIKSNDYLLEILNKTKKILEYKIFFKEHPLVKLKNPKTNFEYSIVNNNKKFENCALVICTNKTSASIDYLLAGYRVAILEEPNFFNFSPLQGNKECKFFKNSFDLVNILNYKRSNSKKKINNFFMTNIELPNWKKIFNEKK